MRDSRRVIQPRSYALALGVALSLALLQGQTCDRGNTDLVSLELEVDGGPNLIVGFSTDNRSYDVSTSGSTVTVRAQAVFGVNDVSWQWLVGTTTIGSGPIGTGSGEVTIPIPIPDGESLLRVVVKSNQVGSTASGFYRINIAKSPWGTAELLETNAGDAGAPQVAVDANGDAVAVWNQFDGTANSVYANRLTSGVWGTRELIPAGGMAIGDASDPQVAVNANGDAVAVWTQEFLAPPGENGGVSVFASRLTSGAWGTAEVLEDRLSDAVQPQVAVAPNGDAVTVWTQFDGTANSVYANRLTSGVWGTMELLEATDGDPGPPQVAVDANGDAVAVWRQVAGTDYSIFANRLTSGVWGTRELLETSVGTVDDPQVAVDASGDAVAVWRQWDGTAYSIFANRLTSGAWGTAELIEFGETGAEAAAPQVAMDGSGNALAVWHQWDGVAVSIASNRYTKLDDAWGTAEQIETGTGSAFDPQVGVDANGDAVAVWTQFDGTADSIASNRYTQGVGWGTAGLLETGTGFSQAPQVGVDANGNAVAVWSQDDGTDYSIYANRSFPVCPGVCGDGITDACEECDDGNNVDGDGCQADCTWILPCSGTPGSGLPDDPDLCKKTITVAIGNLGPDIYIYPYTLEVIPTSPITSNQLFTADLGGTVEITEEILDAAQNVIPGGTSDVAIVDLNATVQTRGVGATGADVALGWGSSVPFECQLTGTACDPANDEAGTPGDRGNADCIPTGTFNPCLRFADLPNSSTLATCLSLDPPGCTPGLCTKSDQHALNGFCITGSLLLPLDPVLGASYMAGDGVSPGQIEALFGWADNPPPATAVGVPPIDVDGTWNMLSTTYTGVAGELGIAMNARGFTLALEGVMGVDSDGPDGPPVGVPGDASPTPDSALVSFPVSQCLIPFVCGDGITDACEECDDGNNIDGDGCQADCTTTPRCCHLPLDFDEVFWEIMGGDMEPRAGTIDTSAPGSYGAIEVFGLAPSMGPDYTIEMQATTPDQETTCIGFADFGTEAAETTDVLFSLQCADNGGACLPEVAVRLKGSSPREAGNDGCARLTKAVVSPLQTSVGNDIDVFAMALDMEGDPITYVWTGPGGSLDDPSAPATTFTCIQVGDQMITVSVSDDDFNSCLDDWTFEVTCVDDQGGGGSGGAGGMGGTGGAICIPDDGA